MFTSCACSDILCGKGNSVPEYSRPQLNCLSIKKNKQNIECQRRAVIPYDPDRALRSPIMT